MSLHFSYVAVDSDGRRVRGSLEARDQDAATEDLKRRGLFPLTLSGSARDGSSTRLRLRWWLTSGEVVQFCRQLALMLRAGLSLLQALKALSRIGGRPTRDMAGRMALAVQAGSSLSEAIRREHKLPPFVVQLVRAAEATGELDEALRRAADHMERRAALRTQVLTSLLYPGLVVVLTCVVTYVLTALVVPKLASFLSQRQIPLPWTTQALMDVSAFAQAHGLMIASTPPLLVLAVLLGRRTRRGRVVIDRLGLAIPVIGGVLQAGATAHLGRTLSLLLGSGLPLVEALQVLRGTFDHQTYVDVVDEARERVLKGEPLARSFAHPCVPALCLEVMAVGEETGELTPVLDELAAFYEERLRHTIRVMSTLFEPAMILCVGGIVGFVYLSFFHAMFMLTAR